MMLIYSHNQRELAEKISTMLAIESIEVSVSRFADQELRIQLKNNLKGKKVIILGDMSSPVNDNLMALLLTADAAINAGAAYLSTIIPYFGYSRQNRISYDYGPISARLVAKLIEASGISELITIDLHSAQIEDFFNIKLQNLDPISLFLPSLQDLTNQVIVSPDLGGENRARNFAKTLNLDLAILKKTRDQNNICQITAIKGDVKDKNCLIIDDIIDSGATILKAAEFLMQNKAKSVSVCATHAVLSGDAINMINNSIIKKIIITNSIGKSIAEINSKSAKYNKFNIVDASALLYKILINSSGN